MSDSPEKPAAPDRLALGLMSGTSLDGIDAALVRTDGERVIRCGPALTVPYGDEMRARLRSVLGGEGPADEIADVGRELTCIHAEVVERLLGEAALAPDDVTVIGFHGHTVLHRPAQRRTMQIGDGALLAELTGIDVVGDFRSADVAAGGQGAPFAPLYHAALGRDLELPLCVLNIGGVANLTWIGEGGTLVAFDTGPGNALIDDWTQNMTGQPMDEGGRLAAAGRANNVALNRMMEAPYFDLPPPKSLDRLDFDTELLTGLLAEDGAATLVAFTCAAVERALVHLPGTPRRWLVSGGGRHNGTLMTVLAARLDAPVAPVEAVGWNGDFIEAEAFAFLAMRSLRGLPLSLPTTTGVPEPLGGGRFFPARA